MADLIGLMNKKITIAAGHYGAGKTNIAVNLAIRSARAGRKTALVDLDTVNPFFRGADNAPMLESLGIKTIYPEYANTNVDLVTIPNGYNLIFNTDYQSVVDVGGDGDGAAVLAADHEKYEKCGYLMYYIYNFYRPSVSDPRDALELLKEIENASKLRFCGIINNSNLGVLTGAGTVKKSFGAAEKLSVISGLPVCAVTVFEKSAFPGAAVLNDITKKLF